MLLQDLAFFGMFVWLNGCLCVPVLNVEEAVH